MGRQGTIGDRAGNFAVQNADFLLVLGCRLNIRQISYAWQHFARDAYKVMVDVDAAELAKPTLTPDLPVHADAAAVIDGLRQRTPGWEPSARHADWLGLVPRAQGAVSGGAARVLGVAATGEPVLLRRGAVRAALPDDDIVVTGDATACITTFQAARLKAGQRLFSDSGCAPMGFDLPAAIGACVAQRASAAWSAWRATGASC